MSELHMLSDGDETSHYGIGASSFELQAFALQAISEVYLATWKSGFPGQHGRTEGADEPETRV